MTPSTHSPPYAQTEVDPQPRARVGLFEAATIVGCLAGSDQPRSAVPAGPRTPATVLAARAVSKRFGHVRALRGAALEVSAGEIVGLVGDNGAGKSTLVKALTGTLPIDAGEVVLDGIPVHLSSPSQAQRAGIEVARQDLALAPDLDAVANLFLGRERLRRRTLIGTLDARRMRREAAELFDRIDVRLPASDLPVRSLSGGRRQILAVIRSIAFVRRAVFLDEPTAALGIRRTELVNALVRQAAERGVAVVIISHNLPERLQLAHRIVVPRLGRDVASIPIEQASTDRLVRAMTGLTP